MKAKITKSDGYTCAPNGFELVTFAQGDIVTGQVAEWALADKAAGRMFDPVAETKPAAPLETKRGKAKKDPK